MDDPLDIDIRGIRTLSIIDGLQKYLEVTEAQMEEVQRLERHILESRAPTSAGEEEYELHVYEVNSLDNAYEEELRPAMRYSFIVLIQIILETRLRSFCSDIQSDRHLGISVMDLRGSVIERAQTFLAKLAGIGVQGFPEWQSLRALQQVRDCVVHAYGSIAESRDEKFLRELAAKGIGVSVAVDGRIAVTK